MTLVYQCRHCSQLIGRLEGEMIKPSLLGFDQLTKKEKREMMEYKSNGEWTIFAICDCCEETFMHHPHYHELDYFIQ
ncbi:anti-sigma-F factor Fin family protein [Ralstonia pickettii]|nr:anti-sigma-F factor Fin family protein [Ralstonia pickettii]